jgi:hypothetical protein
VTPRTRLLAIAVMAIASLGTAACTQGQGEGIVGSDQLWARDCWCSGYNMQPDFFAAVPYRDTLQIRLQHGADVQEISDGVSIVIDDVLAARSELNKPLPVKLPAELEPLATGKVWTLADEAAQCKAESLIAQLPTDDIESKARKEKFETLLAALPSSEEKSDEASIVHMALYLQQSCHNQNIVLHAVSGWIMFTSLFSGDPNEAVGADKLTEAVFSVMVGDPQDAPPDKPGEIPLNRQTRLQGYFNFYFQRGQPAQPFP